MRLLLLLAVASCVEPPTDVEGVSCQVDVTPEESAPQLPLDLVIAVSDAPSMAAYADQLAARLGDLAAVLESLQGGVPSLHVASIDPAAELLVDLELPWFVCDTPFACRERSFDGSLRDAITALGPSSFDGPVAPPLLDRILEAMDAPGFRRADAFLAIVIVTDQDDASVISPEAFGESALADYIGVIGPSTAPRLEPLAQSSISIDADDWADALLWGGVIVDGFPGGCLDDPPTSACVGEGIPPCAMATPDRPAAETPLPCWWIRTSTDPWCPRQAIVERDAPTYDLALLRCPC